MSFSSLLSNKASKPAFEIDENLDVSGGCAQTCGQSCKISCGATCKNTDKDEQK